MSVVNNELAYLAIGVVHRRWCPKRLNSQLNSTRRRVELSCVRYKRGFTFVYNDVALLFVCCLIHCKHLRLSDVNKCTYLLTLTYLLTYANYNAVQLHSLTSAFGERVFLTAHEIKTKCNMLKVECPS